MGHPNNELTIMDLVVELHVGLERQGPGGTAETLKALSFIDEPHKHIKTADLGCGTGGQTLILAQNISGEVVGVDLFAPFTDVLNENAKLKGLTDRVKGIVGNIEELPFEKHELDLIWSEGVIDATDFEKRMTYWKSFLKPGGQVAFTCPSWLTEAHPPEAETFWKDAGCELNSVGETISLLQKSGYRFVAAFTLPKTCWTDQYYVPRTAAEKALRAKYAGNETFEEFSLLNRKEIEIYETYWQHYGYCFYIATAN